MFINANVFRQEFTQTFFVSTRSSVRLLPSFIYVIDFSRKLFFIICHISFMLYLVCVRQTTVV